MNDAQGSAPAANSKAYWRSLEDLADTPEFRERVEREFPSYLDALVDPVSRRRFVQVMGASMALAGLSGCDFLRWPKEKILPFVTRPEGRDPGTPVFYASTIEVGGAGAGVLVKSMDGRPIKIEGNPLHPSSLGGTTPWAQASVLGLYDPDRSAKVIKKGAEKPSSWDAFLAEVGPVFARHRGSGDKGQKMCVLAEASGSPTLAAMRARLLEECPRLRWYEWEPLDREGEAAGARMALGGSYRTHYALEEAAVVVSLDADLFDEHPASVRLQREFAASRRRADREGTMSRMYALESTFSVTGGMADVRVPLQAGQVLHFALRLAAALLDRPTIAGKASEALVKALGDFKAAEDYPLRGLVARIADDLVANAGRSVLAVGPRQPAPLHALAHLVNGLLGNVGATVSYTEAPEQGPSGVEGLASLVNAMKNGGVETLVILGANPVFTAPADLGFAAALERVKTKVHLGLYRDETARACDWHLPMAHYLESWSDARAWDGTVSLVQPLIMPLYAGRTPAELVALVLGGDPKDPEQTSGYALVRRTFQALAPRGADVEVAWRRALHDGVVAGSAWPRVQQLRPNPAQLVATLKELPPETGPGHELVFTACRKIYDGRFANNGWLQELPDPLTKLTWDNAVLMSPETAAELEVGGHVGSMNLDESDVVTLRVEVDGKAYSLDAAILVLPGLPPGTLNLALGYRGESDAAGVVARGAGFNAFELRTTKGLHTVRGVSVTKTGRAYRQATTQDHHAIKRENPVPLMGAPVVAEEAKRRVGELVREGTLERYKELPTFAKNPWDGGPDETGYGPDPATTQLWKQPLEYEGRKWGMAIDLSVCTGCSTCVVACQAENNIAVVGKTEVARGREMHWLRIDRYFSDAPVRGVTDQEVPAAEGAPAGQRPPTSPRPLRVVHQPMPCQQCENAPCEAVCPVAATTHSAEGLNDMVYNRCIGTRYCSNNCPYKVRRFNYFWNYHGPFHPRSEPGNAFLPKLPKSPLPTPEAITAAPLKAVEKMVLNPEVTVRARGVMEKCTYCVQRIKAVTIPADNAGRKVRDGEVQTACQQACPSEAIVFGDLNDPESRVAKLRAHDRSYDILAEYNTRPRTFYMAKLRNLPAEA